MNYLKYFLALSWYIMGFYFFGPVEWVRSPEMAVWSLILILLPLIAIIGPVEGMIFALSFSLIIYGFVWIGGGNSFFPCWIVGSILLFLFSFSDD